jgi:hypothetical protein
MICPRSKSRVTVVISIISASSKTNDATTEKEVVYVWKLRTYPQG